MDPSNTSPLYVRHVDMTIIVSIYVLAILGAMPSASIPISIFIKVWLSFNNVANHFGDQVKSFKMPESILRNTVAFKDLTLLFHMHYEKNVP